MPVLGHKVFKLNDDMNLDDDEEDEKQPLAAVKEKYVSSNSNTTSPSNTSPDVAKKTPRSVVARPPTSHGSKKKTPSSVKRSLEKKSPVILIDDSSSDDEVILSKIATPEAKAALKTPRKATRVSPIKSKSSSKGKSSPVKKLQSPSARFSPLNPFSSPNKLKQKRFQTFCSRLDKLWAAKENEQAARKTKRDYNAFAHMVVTTLQKSEIDRIPDVAIRADIVKRFETHNDRKKVKSMTEDEKKEYLKEKQANKRKVEHQKQKDKKKRYEDTIIESQPLPAAKAVGKPNEISGYQYGDVLMITNFIRAYSALLTPKEDIRLVPDDFANALADSEKGYPYVAKVLLILLHTLIHDEEAEFRQELGVKLKDVELNSSTVGELVRLCLRKQNDDAEDEDDEEKSKTSYMSNTVDVIDEGILEEISGTDFCDLSPSTKLKLIVALSNRLLDSVAVENFQEDVQHQFGEATVEKNAAAHDCNKLSKETKQANDESKPASPLPATVAAEEDDVDDIASKVKRRRLVGEEKAKRDAEERLIKEKEFNEYKTRARLEAANKRFEEIATLKKMLLRTEPLGTDRNHNRYWYFGKWLPYIFVEKGWTSVEESAIGGSIDKEAFEETTFPKLEPNEWLVYESVEDIENLIQVLCKRGVRESKLKERLESCCNELKALKDSAKSATSSVLVKDYVPLMDDFKAKLLQLEASIRAGGLGGVEDFVSWKLVVETSSNVSEIGEKLLQVCNGVRPALLCGVLGQEAQKPKSAQPGVAKRESDGAQSDLKNSNGMQRWCDAVRQCKTWSRLHVLMSMLRSCIRWDRSVEHAKCRICRKKQDDDLALVCDLCNNVYHTYCLRPPLKSLPEGDWFCMDCKPLPPRAAKQLKRDVYIDEDEEDEDEDEEEQENGVVEERENGDAEHNGNCIVCSEGEFEDQSDELITCTECSTSFHFNCHNPPLRHRPRNAWRCSQCTSGRKIRSTRLRSQLDRGCKERSAAGKGASNLFTYNDDLYDDEASSAASSSSGSVSGDKKRKRTN